MSEDKKVNLDKIDALLNKKLKSQTIMSMFQLTDVAVGKLLTDLAKCMVGTDENIAILLALGSARAVIEKAYDVMAKSAEGQAVAGHAYKRVAAFAEVDAETELRKMAGAKKN